MADVGLHKHGFLKMNAKLNEKQKLPHCRDNSNIQFKTHRNMTAYFHGLIHTL